MSSGFLPGEAPSLVSGAPAILAAGPSLPLSSLFDRSLASPTVTVNAAGGQGVALTDSGQLPNSAPATAVPSYTADPGTLAEGMIWLRSDLNQISVYIGGAVKRLAVA